MIEVRRCLDPTNRYIPHLEQLLDVLANRKQIELGLLNDSMAKVQAELRGWRSDDLSSVDSSDCENDIDDEIKAGFLNLQKLFKPLISIWTSPTQAEFVTKDLD